MGPIFFTQGQDGGSNAIKADGDFVNSIAAAIKKNPSHGDFLSGIVMAMMNDPSALKNLGSRPRAMLKSLDETGSNVSPDFISQLLRAYRDQPR